jgi:hypothetical protein
MGLGEGDGEGVGLGEGEGGFVMLRYSHEPYWIAIGSGSVMHPRFDSST